MEMLRSTFGLGFLLVVLVALALVLRFCATDARLRGKSPLIVCVLVFWSFPFGLLAWLAFRPDLKALPAVSRQSAY